MSVEIVPDGWHRRDLEEIAQIRRGITYTAEMLDSGAGLPYVNMKSFLKGGGFNPLGTKTYSGTFGDDDLVGRQDLLIANTDVTSGDIVGAPALLPHELASGRVLYSHHVTRLRLSPDVLVPFFYYLLCLPEYRRLMLQIARGTTVLMLDMQAIKKLPVRAPREIAEQRRIAEILDTLDEAIRKTEQVIAKLQQMKQGLLHDLLTRGIDEHGELRDPDQHPEHFKNSPLGRIPRGWEVRPLRDLLAVRLGFAFRSDDYVERGMLSFRVSNIGREVLDLGEEKYLPAKFWNIFRAQRLHGGEIVIVMVGATTGKLGRVPTGACPALQNQNMWNLVPTSLIDREFLWILLPDAVRRHMNLSQGSARDFLTQKDFLKTLAPVAPVDEQQAIIERARAFDAGLTAEAVELRKLRTLKHGLMDDLLTGRVRVTLPSGATT